MYCSCYSNTGVLHQASPLAAIAAPPRRSLVSKPLSSPPLFHVHWCSPPCRADTSYTLEALGELVLACKPLTTLGAVLWSCPHGLAQSCATLLLGHEATVNRRHTYFSHWAWAGRWRRASLAAMWFWTAGQGFN
jgi:hypothetical protein